MTNNALKSKACNRILTHMKGLLAKQDNSAGFLLKLSPAHLVGCHVELVKFLDILKLVLLVELNQLVVDEDCRKW